MLCVFILFYALKKFYGCIDCLCGLCSISGVVSIFRVTSFKCLGSVITDEGSKLEILSRRTQTTAVLTMLKPVWNDRSISLVPRYD